MKSYIQSSIKGLSHTVNEDDLLVVKNESYHMFFVFDGVGSSVNSQIAIDIVKEYILTNHKNYIKNLEVDFVTLMYDANQSIIQSGNEDAHTTYCSVFNHIKDKNHITISNLGDSRIYSIKQQTIEQLSVDDKDNPQTHILNKCLGDEKLIIKDFRQDKKYVNGDTILLSTDGFHELMEAQPDLFLPTFDGVYLKPVKDKLEKLISGKNEDDSTFLLVK